MILDFSYGEADRTIFEREFASRLPDHILDNHIHVWDKGSLAINKSEYAIHKKYKPWTDFDFIEEFTFTECRTCLHTLFPGKKMDMTCFGLPFPQVDRQKSNEYVIQEASHQGIGFYYMPGQYEDIEKTQHEKHLLENDCFLGFKPYPDLVMKDGDSISIYDMLNPSVLKFANDHRLCIILHIPRKKRMRDTNNRVELIHIAQNYPNMRMVIAHVGRSFTYYDVENSIDFLKPYENVSFDTAFVNDPDVFEYLMHLMPAERIIYGCDAPLAFTRGRDVTINNQHYYVCDHPVPWGIAPMAPDSINLTFYVYEQIRAMLQASRRVYGSHEDNALEQIFHRSALDIIGSRGRFLYA